MTAPVPEDKLRPGGMALRNGLLVHGPTHWAAAVRTEAGELKVASGRKPDLGGRAAERLPGIRGVVKLAEAIGRLPPVKWQPPAARPPRAGARACPRPRGPPAAPPPPRHARRGPRGGGGARERRARVARAPQRRPCGVP